MCNPVMGFMLHC